MAVSPGVRLGPYEILSVLGAGGMGEVYRARDTRLDRILAVKILPETLAADPRFRERFDREMNVRDLQFPFLKRYEVTPDGQRFVVQELTTRRSPLPITVVVNWPARVVKEH